MDDFFEQLPHKHPFRLVSQVKYFSGNDIQTEGLLKSGSLFVAGEFVPQVLAMESILQSCCLWVIGQIKNNLVYTAALEPAVVKIKKVKFEQKLRADESYIINCHCFERIESFFCFNASVKQSDRLVLSGEFHLLM